MTRKVMLFSLLVWVLGDSRTWADSPETPLDFKDYAQIESRYEMAPVLRKVDIVKSGDMLRVLIRAAGPTSCYSQREIERYFEKDLVKIVLRLKRPATTKDCPKNYFEYEEKIYESALAQAPLNLWILGFEGWHKVSLAAYKTKAP